MIDRYFRGQGRLYAADRVGGQPQGFLYLGNVAKLQLLVQTDQVDRQQVRGSSAIADKAIPVEHSCTLRATLENLDRRNLAIACFGTTTAAPAATITDEPVVGYPGRAAFLSRIGLTNFVSLTSSDGAITYAAGFDFAVNLASGRIDVLEGGAIANGQPLLATYTAKASEQVDARSGAPVDRWLVFEGVNTADNSPVMVDLFSVRLNQFQVWEVLGDSFAGLVLEGLVQYDWLQSVPTLFQVRQRVGDYRVGIEVDAIAVVGGCGLDLTIEAKAAFANTYLWEQLSGDPVTILNPAELQPTVVFPLNYFSQDPLVLRLTASNSRQSETAEVEVQTTPTSTFSGASLGANAFRRSPCRAVSCSSFRPFELVEPPPSSLQGFRCKVPGAGGNEYTWDLPLCDGAYLVSTRIQENATGAYVDLQTFVPSDLRKIELCLEHWYRAITTYNFFGQVVEAISCTYYPTAGGGGEFNLADDSIVGISQGASRTDFLRFGQKILSTLR